MENQTTNKIEDFLVYEDKLKLNTLNTTIKVRPNGAYLALIGVDNEELLFFFKSYLNTFENTQIFNYKSEQIIDEIIASNENKTYIIDIYNLPNNFNINNIVQHFRFNRDFIPDKNIRIFIIASNETLDIFSEKAYDFVTFNNFYGKFTNNKFDFQYTVNTERLSSLKKEYKKLKPNTPKLVQLESISSLIEEAINIKDDDTAIKYLKKAIIKSKKLKNKHYQIYFLNLLGKVYMSDKYELALKYFDEALFLTDKDYIGDKAMILSNKATIYKDMKEFDKALLLLNKAINLNQSIGRTNGLAINYLNIAAIYLGGNNNKALKYSLKSLSLQEKLNDKLGITTNYVNIGSIHSALYNFDKSLEYFNKALILAKRNLFQSLIINTLISLGLLSKRLLDFKFALKYFREALSVIDKLNYKKELEVCTLNIKEIDNILNGIDDNNYFNTIPDKNSEIKEDIVKYLIFEANILRNKKNYNEAKIKLQESEKIAENINLKGLQAEVYMSYYDFYLTIDDDQNAIKYYNKANYIIKNAGHKLFEKKLEYIKNSKIQSK